MLLQNEVKECTIPIRDAAYPVPFAPGLEFNPPVHGTWNIVHIGMNLPESLQIYVCAINCMRGVVLTAAEMNCQDRFACVILEEKDVLSGTVEEMTIEGVTDVLNRKEALPPVVLLFTVCTHHFLGCSLKRIYSELEKRFPTVVFARCFMDPIMQKKGLTPDQKLRRAMGELLRDSGKEESNDGSSKRQKSVSLLGCDFPLEEDCDLKRILAKYQVPVKEMHDCGSFEEYRSMGEASHFICTYPPGLAGISGAAKRLAKEFYYLPSCFGYDEIRSEWEILARVITKPDGTETDLSETEITNKLRRWMMEEEQSCEDALAQVRNLLGDTPVTIDGAAHPRPLGLARFLLEHGIRVKRVYLDAVSREEEADFLCLQTDHGDLELTAIIQPEGRVRKRGSEEKILAIGQKAAWYSNTPYFVNIVQGAGLWGYAGIRKLADLMMEAYQQEKDTRDIVPRKGLGCESCI